jgi:hypothetical protein
MVVWLAATLGCSTVSVPTLNVGTLQEDRISIGLEDAQSADVQLAMGTGELTIAPGGSAMLDGTFRYNVKEWKPQIERNTVGGLASVLIQQGQDKEAWGLAGQGARNEWDIRLGTQAPLRLTVNLGAGESDIDLSGVRLSRLSMANGAGDTSIVFRSPNPERMSELAINSGAGRLQLDQLGNANCERLTVKGGAGEVTLDLNGEWTRSATVELITGVGSVTVRVPRTIGVRITTAGSPVGKLIVNDLKSTSEGYVNEAYATAEIKLEISLTTGMGQVTLTAQ